MGHVRYHLTQGFVLFSIFLIWTLCSDGQVIPNASPILSSGRTEEKTATDPYELRTIQVIYQNDQWHVVLTGSESLTYKASKAVDPLRLKIDLPNTVVSPEVLPRHKENEIIGRITAAVFISGFRPLTQIEIDLNRDVSYVITRAQGKIWVTFDSLDLLTGAEPARIEPIGKSKAEDFRDKLVTPTTAPILEEKILSVQPTRTKPVSPAHEVKAIRSIKSDEELRIYILADGSLAEYKTFFLNSPPRLVLDFMEVRSTKIRAVQSVKGSLVKKIRVGLHTEKLRVVFDLVSEKEPSYQIILGEDRLVISFQTGGGFSPQYNK
jgi:hypothetical protein